MEITFDILAGILDAYAYEVVLLTAIILYDI